MTRRVFAVAAVVAIAVLANGTGSAQDLQYLIFERYIDPLRLQSGIPGLSVAVVRDGRIEWEKGFGLQDVEQSIAASPDTLYPIGGATQAMTGVLLGICTDRRQVDVDAAIRQWVPTFPEAGATVRHVLAHSATGRFQYDPGLYAQLTPVVDACSGRPYRVNANIEILERLGMYASVPGLDLGTPGSPSRLQFDEARLARFSESMRRLATPYVVDRHGKAVKTAYTSKSIDAGTGMVSTVRDLAKFDIALDAGVPMSTSTLEQMWSQVVVGGVAQPTGLGWFVQVSSLERLVWTFGHVPDAGSALILKVPGKRATLILLANSPGLAVGANLEQADVTASPFVKAFLRLFL